jgi:hypothetical protein
MTIFFSEESDDNVAIAEEPWKFAVNKQQNTNYSF